MQYSKVKIVGVVEDMAQVYDEDNKPTGRTEKRIRATVIPVKPDPLTINLTKSGDEIINTFKALEGKVVLFPSRMGVTDSGQAFLTLIAGITVDDIDVIPEKKQTAAAIPLPPQPTNANPQGQR